MSTSRQKRAGNRKKQPRSDSTRTAGSRAPRATGSPAGRTAARSAGRSQAKEPSTLASAMEFARRPYTDAGTGRAAGKRSARRAERKRGQVIMSGAPAVVRGGWPGFVILLVGELVTLPFRGNGLVLYWVALIAYAVAGNRAATASLASTPRAARDGGLAAAFAFALTVPLRFEGHSALTLWATVIELAVALIVGALAGAIVARARGRNLRAAKDR